MTALKIDLVTTHLMAPHAHGFHPKNIAVLHETVSSDAVGIRDISDIERYLASKDYGIHGMTDKEGHVAWALGLENAIFWQAGGMNTNSIGIEQVSRVMLQSKSNTVRSHIWASRQAQLRATARILAAWHNAAPTSTRSSSRTRCTPASRPTGTCRSTSVPARGTPTATRRTSAGTTPSSRSSTLRRSTPRRGCASPPGTRTYRLQSFCSEKLCTRTTKGPERGPSSWGVMPLIPA